MVASFFSGFCLCAACWCVDSIGRGQNVKFNERYLAANLGAAAICFIVSIGRRR